MNIFNRVTLNTLRKNKTRTIVTIIGIMLSAAMICAVMTSITSVMNFGLQNMIHEKGDWHGAATSINKDTFDKVFSSAEIEKAVYHQNIGYAVAEGVGNKSKPYLFVMGAGRDFENVMPIHILSGNYPKSTNEILLPEHLATNGHAQHKIGDTLTLAIGERVSGGYPLTQEHELRTAENSESGENEDLSIKETRTYTVVGFYERPTFEPYSAPGYTAITLADTVAAADSTYGIYFKMENPKNIYTFMEDNNLGVKTNNTVLMFSGVARYDNFYSVLYGLAIIVMVLIMFGSISLIYNAFSISVSERTKQFGLLSSVGATKKQLRRTVIFEAFAVSIVGIPLGILLGVGGIGMTLHLIGDKFMSLGGFSIPMRICVSPASIIIACLVALVTVLISAWIPSKRATKVSAVEAIRQNADISVKAKPVKTSKLMYKLFGLPGMLADKYFRRSRKKYRATIISLFMSIVLFVSAAAFTEYLTESVEGSFSSNGYDLICYQNPDDVKKMAPEILMQGLRREEHVQKAAYTYAKVYNSEISSSFINQKYLDNYENKQEPEFSIDDSFINLTTIVYFSDDASFKEVLRENQLTEQDYMNKYKPLAIAIDGNTTFNYDKEMFTTQNVLKSDGGEIRAMRYKEIEGYVISDEEAQYDENGNKLLIYRNMDNWDDDAIKVPEKDYTEYITYYIGKVLYEPPYFVSAGDNLTLVYPYSMASTMLSEDETRSSPVQYYFTSSDHAATYTAMDKFLRINNLDATYVYDYAESVEQNRNIIAIINVFAYGFIVLISLIAAANVFNTVSTNISLRRREFAMLKSVGMTKKGFNSMMNFECLLYGARALLLGLPMSAAITYLIYNAVAEGYETNYHLPWSAIGIAILSVFTVVFATMMYSMRKIKKDNPIDALKNENL